MTDKIIKKRDTYIRFIRATQQIIESDGLSAVSVRKIADKSGLHNSTIYRYFEDADELILLASMKYFEQYINDLALHSSETSPPRENFISIWDYFLDAIAANPSIFYNFFFGRKSDKLNEIITLHFNIFPNEQKVLSPLITNMFYGGNLYERNLHLTASLIGKKSRVTPSNYHLLNEMAVSYCKYKIEEICKNPQFSRKAFKDDVLNMLNHTYFITPCASCTPSM